MLKKQSRKLAQLQKKLEKSQGQNSDQERQKLLEMVLAELNKEVNKYIKTSFSPD